MLPFKVIRSNVWHASVLKLRTLEPSEACSCPGTDTVVKSCLDDSCLNRRTKTECDAKVYPSGHECGNQRMQRGHTAKTQVEDTQTSKGQGLFSRQAIRKGGLVAEYTGEIISQAELERRMKEEYAGLQDTYIMSYVNGLVIDATLKGSCARYINHSCDPNCLSEKWLCGGETRVGIYAQRNIAAGEEITYNYNLEWNGFAQIRCQCGASNCVGWLGKKGNRARDVEVPLRGLGTEESDEEAAQGSYVPDLSGMRCKLQQLDMQQPKGWHVSPAWPDSLGVFENGQAPKRRRRDVNPQALQEAVTHCAAEVPLYPSVFDSMNTQAWVVEDVASGRCPSASGTGTRGDGTPCRSVLTAPLEKTASAAAEHTRYEMDWGNRLAAISRLLLGLQQRS